MDITFTLQSTTDGALLTGQAANVTVYISIDGAAFTASTNAAQEIGRGLYKVTLTSAESEFTTLYYQPVCSGAQTNLWSYDAPVTMPTVPTASDNAQAVWGAQDKVVTIDSTQASTLAAASDLDSVATKVELIKSKTDNLPTNPAAVGSEMALTSETIASVKDGLATISATDALAVGLDALANYGDAHWSTAAGFATPSDVAAAVEAIVAALPSDYSKTTDVSSAQTALTALINSVLSGIFHWAVEGSILTIYNASNVAIGAYTLTKDSSGNITAVTPIVQPEPETNNAE